MSIELFPLASKTSAGRNSGFYSNELLSEYVRPGSSREPGVEEEELELELNDSEMHALLHETLEHQSDSAGPVSSHDKETLRRVAGPIPYSAFLIALIELAERFSYYGSTIVFTNFIQQPPGREGQPGALGLGQKMSSGFSSLNTLWVYTMPTVGAVVADSWLGRFKTICWAIPFAILGHLILVVSALPSTLETPLFAFKIFALAVFILGIGTGAVKANISPLIAEQATVKVLTIERLPSGERVLVDPALTTSKIYLYFYFTINLGAVLGQISMTYVERFYGFGLAFLLPTLVFLFCPIILFVGRRRYTRNPPTGSVILQLFRFLRFATKGRWKSPRRLLRGEFWDQARPSRVPIAKRPKFMTFDDAWVDEVRRGLNCCAVFFWYPLYWLAYNQLSSNLTSQAAVLNCGSLPNDMISNLDPIAIIILIPLADHYLYPALSRAKVRFTPIKRITLGFVFAALSMLCAGLVQGEIYKRSACGTAASTCLEMPYVDLSVFVQTPSILLLAISEILAAVTGLEYAYSKAPVSMRSLVMSILLLQGAFSGALGIIFLPLAQDPFLQVNYYTMGTLCTLSSIGFWWTFRHLDAAEDDMNELPEGKLVSHALVDR